jgi:cell wall-associated NlpC family hydrolase
MSNSTLLRPVARVALSVAILSGGLALPAAAATPTTTVSAEPAAIADLVPLDRGAVERAARAERRREARQHRREVRKRRHARREHRRQVRNLKVLRAFDIALRQQGDPYVWGATGPDAFDCSGLTSYAYDRAGLSLPRTSAAQSGAVRRIPRSQMRRGDLVFFSDGGHVYHVGLYAGQHHGTDYILHAPRPGEDVAVVPIWTGDWFGGTLR